jgi:hypothetical protein
MAVTPEPLRTRNLTQQVKFRGSQVNYSGPRPRWAGGPLERVGAAIARLRKFLADWRGDQPPNPHRDPYAWQPVPRKPGPKGRSGAVAVAEPDENPKLDLKGSSFGARKRT